MEIIKRTFADVDKTLHVETLMH